MSRLPLLLALAVLGCGREAARDAAATSDLIAPRTAPPNGILRKAVTATLTFTPPAAERGTLILAKNNPSGLSEHEAELRIPVRFR